MAVTRTFEDGKMIISFPNGREIVTTVDQLENRKTNAPAMITRRNERIDTLITQQTERIAEEEEEEIKTMMEAGLVRMQQIKTNIPSVEDRQDELQGWIDSANASL